MTGTLHEDQYTLSIYLAQIFLEWRVFYMKTIIYTFDLCRLILLRMTGTLHEDQYTLSIYVA